MIFIISSPVVHVMMLLVVVVLAGSSAATPQLPKSLLSLLLLAALSTSSWCCIIAYSSSIQQKQCKKMLACTLCSEPLQRNSLYCVKTTGRTVCAMQHKSKPQALVEGSDGLTASLPPRTCLLRSPVSPHMHSPAPFPSQPNYSSY